MFDAIPGPAHWAPALVNGDQSGMTTEEVMHLNAWRRRLRIANVVGTTDDDPRWTRHLRLYAPECNTDSGELRDYLCERILD